jgi:hypothetical protein
MAALSALCIAGSRAVVDPAWQGLALNLSATAIGVLVTVFYLDTVLQWRERDRWAPTEEIVVNELVRLAGRAVAVIEGVYAGPKPVTALERIDERTNDLVLDETHIRFLEHEVAAALHASLKEKDDTQWAQFAAGVEILRNDVESLVTLYGERFSPEAFARAARIHSHLTGIQTFMNLRPRMAETATDMVAVTLQLLLKDSLAVLTDYWSF